MLEKGFKKLMPEIILERGPVVQRELAAAISFLSSSYGQQMPRRLSETFEEASCLLAPQLHTCRSAWGQFHASLSGGSKLESEAATSSDGRTSSCKNSKMRRLMIRHAQRTMTADWLQALVPTVAPLRK